ncbi:hypothetical protein FBZ93_10350 [Bradyrhizobium macuxiense]|uniref:Uncharacterized protein n=1 Tax=Bradyrhizobium macuxiense TaxID=1755647 RepID=A0A560MBP8_9BRAD|nr:hypothetical protein [Bradyrhizobium macuxiense]TWC05040.1 hypothetical protein FBZ93_10350 [Bradyrhizobium macuxiense]
MTDLRDDDPEHLAEMLEAAAAMVRHRSKRRTWIDQFRNDEVLVASAAALVAGVDPETIRRWCAATADTDRPLGYRVADLWLVDAFELLHQIEKRRDLHARRRVETELKAYWAERAQARRSQGLCLDVVTRREVEGA